MKAVALLLTLALLTALGALWYTSSALDAERLAHQTTKVVYAAQVVAAERAARELSEKYRLKEQELNHAQESNAAEVAALHLNLSRSIAAGNLASKRLRDATKSLADKARAQCADSSASELRPSTDDPIGVLAHVLGRADERAGVLADLADRRAIAGAACERAYDAAREALQDDDYVIQK